jgi:predicted CxxxxCH...CXXCH cytochrome family protein
VEVSILPAYGASAVLNSDKTCSNVSCHGGKQTPVWSSTSSGCTACHVNPDGSPNSGRHQKHVNGVELKLPCASCHYGAGYGTPLHANGTVNIDVSPLFDENGAVNFNTIVPGKCTNLSCHAYGARPTVLGTSAFPVWTDPNTTLFNPKCAITCHKVSSAYQPADTTTIPVPYYNGPFSGNNDNPDISGGYPSSATAFGPGSGKYNLHQFHVSGNNCTECHDITGRHFLKLNQGQGRRRILPGEAAVTLKGSSITSYDYETTKKGGCVATCHPARIQYWYK